MSILVCRTRALRCRHDVLSEDAESEKTNPAVHLRDFMSILSYLLHYPERHIEHPILRTMIGQVLKRKS